MNKNPVALLLLSVAPPRVRAAAYDVDACERALMDSDDEKTQMRYAAALAEFARSETEAAMAKVYSSEVAERVAFEARGDRREPIYRDDADRLTHLQVIGAAMGRAVEAAAHAAGLRTSPSRARRGAAQRRSRRG